MFTCPACSRRGVSVGARLLVRLYEPITCGECGTRLIANAKLQVASLVLTLSFVVVGLVAFSVALPWLIAVIVLYVTARVTLGICLPLAVASRSLNALPPRSK